MLALPNSMEKFKVNHNNFSGEIALHALPANMTDLHLENNKLTGSLGIINLPEYIEVINLENNSFRGEFQLSDLSKSYEVISTYSDATSTEVILRNPTLRYRCCFYFDLLEPVLDKEKEWYEWKGEITLRFSNKEDR